MKIAVKRFIIAAVAAGFIMGISSCEKHTCPTYSKVEAKQQSAKA